VAIPLHDFDDFLKDVFKIPDWRLESRFGHMTTSYRNWILLPKVRRLIPIKNSFKPVLVGTESDSNALVKGQS